MLMDSGHTLLTILGDILDFSKIDAHAMTLQTQLVDLRSPMEASLQMVRRITDCGRRLCSAPQLPDTSTRHTTCQHTLFGLALSMLQDNSWLGSRPYLQLLTCLQVAADAERKGLQLAYSLHPDLAARSFLGDPLRIRQVRALPTTRNIQHEQPLFPGGATCGAAAVPDIAAPLVSTLPALCSHRPQPATFLVIRLCAGAGESAGQRSQIYGAGRGGDDRHG
jgi:hypothetical protein